MANLQLTANGNAQKQILAYLVDNASEVLAEKINNGTAFEKDGKQLINKKSLDGFMKYANGEARKLAEKGATYACIENETVYGWAIHYFEEENIEGTLYNLDGTEYKPVIKSQPKTNTPSVVASKPKKPSGQTSLFDLIENELESKDDTEEDTEEIESEELEDSAVEESEEPEVEIKVEPPKIQPKTKFYLKYLEIQAKYPQDIVVYRLGDFYEAFADSAVTLSKELDLTLTGRDLGLDERVPMVGFPYHVADNYFNKIRIKHNVAVIEQEQVKLLAMNAQRISGHTVDLDTGEVLDVDTQSNELSQIISRLLDNKIKIVR